MKFATTLVLSVVMVTGLLFAMTNIQSADAVKSSGTKNQQYGKSAEIRVCGTHFCKSDPSMNLQVDPEKNKPTQDDLNAVFQRMDKIKKQHQDKISEKWRLMTNIEKVQFIHIMNQILSDMESMNMDDHMSKMMNGYDVMKHDYAKHGSKKMKYSSDMDMMPERKMKSEKSE
jgi:hypothetical protein